MVDSGVDYCCENHSYSITLSRAGRRQVVAFRAISRLRPKQACRVVINCGNGEQRIGTERMLKPCPFDSIDGGRVVYCSQQPLLYSERRLCTNPVLKVSRRVVFSSRVNKIFSTCVTRRYCMKRVVAYQGSYIILGVDLRRLVIVHFIQLVSKILIEKDLISYLSMRVGG